MKHLTVAALIISVISLFCNFLLWDEVKKSQNMVITYTEDMANFYQLCRSDVKELNVKFTNFNESDDARVKSLEEKLDSLNLELESLKKGKKK